MKVLKPDPTPADSGKEMGAPAVTTNPFHFSERRELTGLRRTGIWLLVVGSVLTFIGGLTVVVTRGDSDPAGVVATDDPPAALEEGANTATTIVGAPAADRQPGTIDPGTQPVTPASATAPPPATPEQVAELLAGLPLQLQQAATSSGQPREL
ncbi:MAG TPA: hypothetical protein VF244_06565, partial [Acidimicrobiales bacterium]